MIHQQPSPSRAHSFPRRLPILFGIVGLAAVYGIPVRRWMGQWGSTPEERMRAMAGDAIIANPTHKDTQAVTVDAPAGDIWPWLMQLGSERGGLYSYDWLDRLFGFLKGPSSSSILPEFQHPAVGDRIAWGNDSSRWQPLSPIAPSS